MGSKTRLITSCTKQRANLVTSRKLNTRLARPIMPMKTKQEVCALFTFINKVDYITTSLNVQTRNGSKPLSKAYVKDGMPCPYINICLNR